MTRVSTAMLTGWLCVSLLMLALWVVHLAMRNAGIVDAGWAGGLALLGIYYAIAQDKQRFLRSLRRALVLGEG